MIGDGGVSVTPLGVGGVANKSKN